MREISPFDYWRSHSSAIEGMGGRDRSPDPRYLFHTSYHDVRPGRARFILRLQGVRASFGELSTRVHAWKPDTDANISLVSGGRVLLDQEQGSDITLPVHFASQKGVRYALYGYLSEHSDVTARTLEIAIDEPDNGGDVLPEPPRSVLALARRVEETRPANALLHYGRVTTAHPVSQSCTIEQVASLGLVTTGFFARERAEDNDEVIARWSEIISLAALDTYGATDSGFEGLVVGPVSSTYTAHLARYASITRVDDEQPPPRASGEFYDFLLMPKSLGAVADAASDPRERWATIVDWLARLKLGGLAMLGLRYCPDGDLVSSASLCDAKALSRNEIGQWTLKLIGNGYSAAPLAFASMSELVLDRRGFAGFMMIVQRI